MYENRCDGGGMDLWILFENVGGCGGMVDIEQRRNIDLYLLLRRCYKSGDIW